MTRAGIVCLPFDLNDVVRARGDALRGSMNAGCTLDLALGAGLPPVWADPDRIGDVLVDLVGAARDSMSAGGTIRISSELRARAGHAPAVGGRMVSLSVTASGSVEPPLCVRAAVEWNHGTFEVLSLPEGGTRCTVHLSAFPDALNSEPHHRTDAGDRRERRFGGFGPKDRAVLLVEDDPDVRELLRAALARTGHPVVTADDGVAALERLLDRDERPIALIVTDVVMPRMGGYALAEHATAVIPDINVVFITGYRDRDAPAGGIVLQKPFSPEALFALVTEKLEAS